MTISDFRTWFDARFSLLAQEKIEAFSSQSKSAEVAEIASYITPLAQNGKRFRPFLVYSASGLDTEGADEHFLLLASVEFLHIFALIHDDIMDEADTRHAVLCAHNKFGQEYTPQIGEGIAILLGDIVFAWAYECLLEYMKAFPNLSGRVSVEFSRLIREVTHGQLLDILSPAQAPLSKEALVEKMTLKTARYSFVQPMRLGFVIAGDQETDQEFAESFGIPLGIGFQLQDDLLDITESEQTGKTCFSDIPSGQQTFLSWYMHNHASPEERTEFLVYFGKKESLSASEQSQLLEVLENSGALRYVQGECEHYFREANNTLELYDKERSSAWKDVIALVQERTK